MVVRCVVCLGRVSVYCVHYGHHPSPPSIDQSIKVFTLGKEGMSSIRYSSSHGTHHKPAATGLAHARNTNSQPNPAHVHREISEILGILYLGEGGNVVHEVPAELRADHAGVAAHRGDLLLYVVVYISETEVGSTLW